MANVDLVRSAQINYSTVEDTTFDSGDVSFTIDGIAEDFSSSAITLEVYEGEDQVYSIDESSGITVTGNSLNYVITAANMTANLEKGSYKYVVLKTTGAVIEQIQHGALKVLKNTSPNAC